MLKESEVSVLKNLQQNGDNLPANVADNIGYHRVTISRALSKLEGMNLVRDKGRSVYTITERGERVLSEGLESLEDLS